jgi:hypothetical protein
MNGPLELTFSPAKETKGTWKFEEDLPSEFAEAKIGTLYVRKATLGELGYVSGQKLDVTVAISGG